VWLEATCWTRLAGQADALPGARRAHAAAHNEAEAAEEQPTRHQRQRRDEQRSLAHGFFSSAALAFS
jgi:hypothetical protein